MIYKIVIQNGRCPKCKNKLHVVTEEDFESVSNEDNASETFSELSIVEVIEDNSNQENWEQYLTFFLVVDERAPYFI
jgi:uncharacterized protein YbaR (Trm112 family)